MQRKVQALATGYQEKAQVPQFRKTAETAFTCKNAAALEGLLTVSMWSWRKQQHGAALFKLKLAK